MPSPSDRFTQMEKIAIFLIAIGEEKTRQVLADLDFDTIEAINHAIVGLGDLSVQERAAVMIEFGDLFFKGIPLSSKLEPTAPRQGAPPKPPVVGGTRPGANGPPPLDTPVERAQGRSAPGREERPDDAHEQAARNAMQHLKEHVDPGQIDWGRAGYDFGEGFRGPAGGRDR